ncbi:MAG: NADH-quinone oxidoreductase subunit NuoE [Halanaerobium sp.]|nr:NADH-quinone oxidoreductase subunit NuoE [Halanaerobium sp.]
MRVSDGKFVKIFRKYQGEPTPLLSVLKEVQNERGYLAEDDLRLVAKELEVPISKVYGVATFYSLFQLEPKGKYVIRICESAPCHVKGAVDVLEAIQEELNIHVGETTEDGLFSLELSSCLGLCGVAPAMLINQEAYGNLDRSRVRQILAQLRGGGE